MRFVLFYHSFASCWNHGNAHFLRGVTRELIRLGHDVTVYEPIDGWSRANALRDGGATAIEEAAQLVPGVELQLYAPQSVDLDRAVHGADAVVVHEWNAPELVAALGVKRAAGGRFRLLFHDTHHRAVSARPAMEKFDLDGYDGVLAFGEVLRELYLARGWGRRVFTWHEAADTALFRVHAGAAKDTDVIWIGNWGDDERAEELERYLIDPVTQLGLRTLIHGVRYPPDVRDRLSARGIGYGGWLPNHHAPRAFARSRLTVHVPRRPYVEALPGIPTIRMFEALACGIPLVSAPWSDVEALFPPGSFLMARDAQEMRAAMSLLLKDEELAEELARTGLRTIWTRHTCGHRVRELLDVLASIDGELPSRAVSHPPLEAMVEQ